MEIHDILRSNQFAALERAALASEEALVRQHNSIAAELRKELAGIDEGLRRFDVETRERLSAADALINATQAEMTRLCGQREAERIALEQTRAEMFGNRRTEILARLQPPGPLSRGGWIAPRAPGGTEPTPQP